MTSRVRLKVLSARNELVSAPTVRACNDQSFEVPTEIYIAMGLMFAGFIGVLAFAFRSNMSVSYGVIFAFLTAYFAIPALFPRVGRGLNRTKALDWPVFREKGIETATGHSTSVEATILILLLPFLILCFGISVTIIAAVV
jgi:hypothetical protein